MNRFLLLLCALCACGSSACSEPSVREDAGPREPPDAQSFVVGPGGALGVCCPQDTPSCECIRTGGWAPSLAACSTSCNVANWNPAWDSWGCPIFVDGGRSCTDPEPTVGSFCNPGRGCPEATATCLHEDVLGFAELGGPGDPILGHPEGEETFVPRDLYPGGMCTFSYPELTPALCDPEAPEAVCTLAGDCVEIDVGPVCFRKCDPSVLPRDDCRPGFQCHPELAVCIAGCTRDDHCRIARQETNGIEGLQTPADCADAPTACTPTDCADAPADPEACADPVSNFDRLVYDTESIAVCNTQSHRCIE